MKNILISWRHIKNNKVNSLINIVGLGIALGVFAVAMVFVDYEYSYDRCFKDSGRIYLTNYQRKSLYGDITYTSSHSPFAISNAMIENVPQVEDAVAISMFKVEMNIENGNQTIEVNGTTSNYFRMFGIRVLEGDISSLDNSLTSIVLTHSEAKRIFGDDGSYVGRTIPVKWNVNNIHYNPEIGSYMVSPYIERNAIMAVVAVVADYPHNVTYSRNAFVSPEFYTGFNAEEKSIETIKERLNTLDFDDTQYRVYVKLAKWINAKESESQINEDVRRNYESEFEDISISLKPITEFHFEESPHNLFLCRTTFIIGLLILLIAFFNYVNLASATADRRLRTQAICQINGAQTGNIVWQSIVESLMLIVLSLPLSVLVAIYGLPKMCTLFGIDAELSFFSNFATIATIWTITSALFGLFSGLAIKFRLRRISLADAVKSSVIKTGDRLIFTNILTIIQIAVFCGLFASILLMNRQIKYALKVDLGFDQDGLLVVETQDGQYSIFKEEMNKMPGIIAFSGASSAIIENTNIYSVELVDSANMSMYPSIEVDKNFFKTIGAKVMEGSDEVEEQKPFWCNQMAKKNNWEIGQIYRFGVLNGVVNDFSFLNIHTQIGPMVFLYLDKEFERAFLRINLMQTPNIVSDIEKVWKKTFPDTDFNWYFADAKIAESYQKDRNYSFVISALTIIALFIAIIGIIGLSTALNHKRVKEIGIRKVNGATSAEILQMLCRRYIWMVAVAIAISVPCAYSFVTYWLKDFAYKISITPEPFIISAIATLLIVLATVAIQSLSVARRNPVEAIKTE